MFLALEVRFHPSHFRGLFFGVFEFWASLAGPATSQEVSGDGTETLFEWKIHRLKNTVGTLQDCAGTNA